MRQWRKKAACWKSSVDFHNDKNPAAAKTLCSQCEVRPDCLAWAIRTEIRDNTSMPSVWGGMTTAERRKQYPLDKTRYRQAERKLA